MLTKRSFSSLISDPSNGVSLNKKRKLRRLPNVYSNVLELPLMSSSDGDVSIDERRDYFIFVAKAGTFGGDGSVVRACVVEDHPGVTKLLVSASGCDNADELSVGEMSNELLRFRLPVNALLDAAKAVCVDGELVVVVPKTG